MHLLFKGISSIQVRSITLILAPHYYLYPERTESAHVTSAKNLWALTATMMTIALYKIRVIFNHATVINPT